MPSDLLEHLLVLDRARPGDADGVAAANLDRRHASAADLNDAVIFMKLAARELVRLHDRDDLFHALKARQVIDIERSLFADRADDGAELAAGEVGLGAHPFDLRL